MLINDKGSVRSSLKNESGCYQNLNTITSLIPLKDRLVIDLIRPLKYLTNIIFDLILFFQLFKKLLYSIKQMIFYE